jgi:hypothetical protein
MSRRKSGPLAWFLSLEPSGFIEVEPGASGAKPSLSLGRIFERLVGRLGWVEVGKGEAIG